MQAPERVRWIALGSFAVLGLGTMIPLLARYYWPVGGGLDITGHPIGRDFINVWASPRLAFGGEVAAVFDVRAYAAAIDRLYGTPLPSHSWSYPPFALLMLWPFAALPYGTALAAWTVVLFAGYAWVTIAELRAPERRTALALLVVAPACLVNVIGGQNGFLTGFLLIGGLLAIDRRPWLAGLMFGLLTYKPNLGLLLPFVLIALGAWRTIASACVTALLLFAVSAAVFGLEPWRAYFVDVRAFLFLLLEHFDGFYPYMMTSVYAGARTFGLSSHAAFAAQAAVSLPVLAATVWGVRRSRDTRQRTALVVCAVPLLTPYVFNYDLTAIAAVVVWRLSAPTLDPAAPRLLAAWLIPALMVPLNVMGIGAAPLVLVVLYLTVLRETVGTVRAVPESPVSANAPATA